MMWNNSEIRVPYVPWSRPHCVRRLYAQLISQLPKETKITLSPHEEGQPPDTHVPRVFTPPVTGEWMVYLQDDVILAPDFQYVLPRVVAEADCKVVSFFDPREGVGLHNVNPSRFAWAQCIAIHASLTEAFPAYYADWLDRNPQHYHAMDYGFGSYIGSIGEEIKVYRPSAVQHAVGPSTFKGRAHDRRSPTFTTTYGDYHA